MLRLVLDTNVCLDLFVFADPRAAVLAEALACGTANAFTRADCRDEWRRVLRYPALGLDGARCIVLEQAYDARMHACEGTPSHIVLPRCRDPDDQKFLELARDSGAHALVTRDAELLALARSARHVASFTIVEPVAVTREWLHHAAMASAPTPPVAAAQLRNLRSSRIRS